MPDSAPNPITPHPVLDRYYDHADARRRKVQQMFDNSASHYDWIIRVMSFGSGGWYRDQAMRRSEVGAGAQLLDVGCGTGAVALQAQRRVGQSGRVIGLDPSEKMLDCARRNGVTHPVRGRGEALPFADREFDHLTMGYALRHVCDLRAAFSEYLRVLRPGGRVLLMEISRPQPGLMYTLIRFYMKRVVPLFTRVFRRSLDAEELMAYYWDTIEQCVPPESILEAMRGAGFTGVERHVVMGVFSEYRGTRPQEGQA